MQDNVILTVQYAPDISGTLFEADTPMMLAEDDFLKQLADVDGVNLPYLYIGKP